MIVGIEFLIAVSIIAVLLAIPYVMFCIKDARETRKICEALKETWRKKNE